MEGVLFLTAEFILLPSLYFSVLRQVFYRGEIFFTAEQRAQCVQVFMVYIQKVSKSDEDKRALLYKRRL